MSAHTREELLVMAKVDPTGDWAEAEDAEAGRTAARQLAQDARDHGAGDPLAAFYVDGELFRSGIRRAEL